MFHRVALAGALAGLALAGSANAASLPPLNAPDYEGIYGVESVNTGPNLHTFWLPNFIEGASNYWQFDSNGGLFVYDNDTARLTGTIVNNSDATKKFSVDVTFDEIPASKGARTPKCELGGACGSVQYQDQANFFEYFTYDEATLTGLDMLSGVTLLLTMAPEDGRYPPQLGYGANNKDIDEFGLSTWFFWELVMEQQALGVAYDGYGSPYKAYGQGDINIELTAVPLPASLAMLIGALGGLGFLGRRRKAA